MDPARKEAAAKLLADYHVVPTVEQILNELVSVQPSDPYALMSLKFADKAALPTVVKVY